jgi:hypothetical protein
LIIGAPFVNAQMYFAENQQTLPDRHKSFAFETAGADFQLVANEIPASNKSALILSSGISIIFL